jgi:hypothetical protein
MLAARLSHPGKWTQTPILPTSDWTVSQIENGTLPYPQPSGHFMLQGSVQYLDGPFCVNMRIDDLETGEILMTSKGEGWDWPDGLDNAVANALAKLAATIKSYSPAQGPAAPFQNQLRPSCASSLRHRHRRVRSAWLAQEARKPRRWLQPERQTQFSITENRREAVFLFYASRFAKCLLLASRDVSLHRKNQSLA